MRTFDLHVFTKTSSW
uniref:Uncharacterized protein n=1 Tax=Rhizophora mucronata TaxID=61149 RepID=A0A2P2L598_RHIMU